MLTTLAVPRLAGSGGRVLAVAGRNVVALRSVGWLVFASGALEPFLYLFSIGIGVGALVGDMTLPDGTVVGYAAFVAPAMLAASAMTGALTETTFNFFGKMKFWKLYDSVLATPVGPMEVALGELSWAMARGALYAGSFLTVMIAMDLTSPWRALLALPATVLIGFAFGAVGMLTATWLRGWQDFDLIGTIQFALFLFSGTFVPATAYPAVLRWIVEVTPLYRAVDLIRGITAGDLGWIQALDVAYLLVMLIFCLWAASRRMSRMLRK
ncbi:ABC transporter permease [Catenuloplanes atrovinosus]|uniref:Transport permease protein n=1 Tax=Catenuloplanes atrovinosus TaxID=137266 RepID=A0AAE3YRA8_9ACTN|nr:ABC transporter permease [Catenuloplanes atrovinosus]MDR7278543.1 lipooligosaccharide transport system permease protein [Catenuloplanes atrovinosus]